MDDTRINNILNKITLYFTNKYPTTFPVIGLSENDLKQLIHKSLQNTENANVSHKDKKQLLSQNINNLISVIERKINTKIYSENRNKNTVNTNQFTMDPHTEISYKGYTDDFNAKSLVGSPNIEKTNLNNGKDLKSISYANLEPNELGKIIKSFSLDKDIDKQNITLTEGHLEQINKLLNKEDNILKDRMDDLNLLYEEEREFDYNIVIDSKDRDYTKYVYPNNFVIDFSPPSGSSSEINMGYINRAFGNIIRCELINVIILDTTEEDDSSDSNNAKIPYLLLEISELGGNYEGTNDEISKSFAILTNYNLSGGYKHYLLDSVNSDRITKKIYNPRINLNRMTIKIKKPDGSLYNFGEVNKENINTVVKLSFRITTLQKNLGTKFIGKATY
jgi:hypothetical protein